MTINILCAFNDKIKHYKDHDYMKGLNDAGAAASAGCCCCCSFAAGFAAGGATAAGKGLITG